MDRQEIAERIRAHLESSYPVGEADLDLESELLDTVLSDSLAIVSTVAFLEDEFTIRVKRAHINRRTFHSIRTLSEYVADQVGV